MTIIDFQELTHVHLIHVRIMEYVRQFKVLAPSSNVNVTAASLELLVIYVSQHQCLSFGKCDQRPFVNHFSMFHGYLCMKYKIKNSQL